MTWKICAVLFDAIFQCWCVIIELWLWRNFVGLSRQKGRFQREYTHITCLKCTIPVFPDMSKLFTFGLSTVGGCLCSASHSLSLRTRSLGRMREKWVWHDLSSNFLAEHLSSLWMIVRNTRLSIRSKLPSLTPDPSLKPYRFFPDNFFFFKHKS